MARKYEGNDDHLAVLAALRAANNTEPSDAECLAARQAYEAHCYRHRHAYDLEAWRAALIAARNRWNDDLDVLSRQLSRRE